MNKITRNSMADLEFELTWKSDVGWHREIYLAQKVNFWRDVMPERVKRELMGSSPGSDVHASFAPARAPPLKRNKHIQPRIIALHAIVAQVHP